MWPDPQGTADLVTFTEEILKTKKTNISIFGYRLKKIRVGR